MVLAIAMNGKGVKKPWDLRNRHWDVQARANSGTLDALTAGYMHSSYLPPNGRSANNEPFIHIGSNYFRREDSDDNGYLSNNNFTLRAKLAFYGLAAAFILACSGSAGAVNPANTPAPTSTRQVEDTQQPPKTLEAEVSNTTMPPNFLVDGSSVEYTESMVSAKINNTGGLGNIVGKLYHLNDPNNPEGTLLAQSSLQLAANNSGKIYIRGFELSPGIDYNLRVNYINPATGEIIQTFNFSKYVPRAAELQFNAVYDKDGKEVKLAFANASKDPRDKSAENVSIEFLYQGKSSGQLNRNGTSFTPNSSIEGVVPITDIEKAINRELGPGTHEITAQIRYHDGFQERGYTKTFVVDVPLPDLQIAGINTNFLQVNDNDVITLYNFEITGTYGTTKPDKPFDVEVKITGLEGRVKKLVHQVTRINDNGTFTLEIPEVSLLDKNGPTYSISAVADIGNVINEQNERNNKSEVFKLKVYEPVTATQEQFDYFAKAVGQSINKFKNTVYVSFYGSADKTIKPPAERIETFKSGATDIERATNGNLTFRYTEPPADAPVLEVYLDVPHSDLYAIFPNDTPKFLDKVAGAWDTIEITPDGYIQKARIAVSNKYNIREVLNFSTLHELMNITGLMDDQVDGPIDSVLNDEAPRSKDKFPQQYSPLDLKLFGILYSPNVKPHMSPDQARKFIRITDAPKY